MAGSSMVRNTEFGRRFLYLWESYEYHKPVGYSSSDNGALHLALIEAIGLQDVKQCFNEYANLTATVNDLNPYYNFVRCTRLLTGPGRRWKVGGDREEGIITILNRFQAWVIDASVIYFYFGTVYPFHHNIKDISLKSLYNPVISRDDLNHTLCYMDPPLENQKKDAEFLLDYVKTAELKFTQSAAHLKTVAWNVIPRWNLNDCITDWNCEPLENEAVVSSPSLPYIPGLHDDTIVNFEPKRGV